MKVIGHRFCHVASADDAAGFNAMLQNLGLQQKDIGDIGEGFSGGVYEAGNDASMIQVWTEGPQMPAGTMLQIVVDDAEAFAAHAREQGLEPQGPFDMHGERVFMLTAPGGMPVSFQSAL